MNRVPMWAYKCILAASVIFIFRTIIGRPVVASIASLSVYPVRGRREVLGGKKTADTSWDSVPKFAVKTINGMTIHGSIIEKPASGEYIIYCLGNASLYDCSPADIRKEIDKNQVFFHPPGYGESSGGSTF